jgi:hypothetical protein
LRRSSVLYHSRKKNMAQPPPLPPPPPGQLRGHLQFVGDSAVINMVLPPGVLRSLRQHTRRRGMSSNAPASAASSSGSAPAPASAVESRPGGVHVVWEPPAVPVKVPHRPPRGFPGVGHPPTLPPSGPQAFAPASASASRLSASAPSSLESRPGHQSEVGRCPFGSSDAPSSSPSGTPPPPGLRGDVAPASAFHSGSSCDADRPTAKDALPAQVFLDGLCGKVVKKMWVVPSRIPLKPRPNYIWARVRGEGDEVWPDPEWHTPTSAINDSVLKIRRRPKEDIKVFSPNGSTDGISLQVFLKENGLQKQETRKRKCT